MTNLAEVRGRQTQPQGGPTLPGGKERTTARIRPLGDQVLRQSRGQFFLDVGNECSEHSPVLHGAKSLDGRGSPRFERRGPKVDDARHLVRQIRLKQQHEYRLCRPHNGQSRGESDPLGEFESLLEERVRQLPSNDLGDSPKVGG